MHPLCPFAGKPVLAFALKEVAFQRCYIDFREKTEWHKQLADGLVPFLELPSGQIVRESAVIIRKIAEDYDSGVELWPKDSREKYDKAM